MTNMPDDRRSDLSKMTTTPGVVPLYRQDPAHKMPGARLSDEAYKQAIDGMVIVDADVVILNRERETFYLATRRHLPMAGLWLIGGRLNAGEYETDGMRRIFRRETGLDLPVARFGSVVKIVRYMWSDREQEPRNVGSDNLAYTFSAELAPDELDQVIKSLDPEEYDVSAGLRELGRDELSQLHEKGELHPHIWHLYIDIFGN